MAFLGNGVGHHRVSWEPDRNLKKTRQINVGRFIKNNHDPGFWIFDLIFIWYIFNAQISYSFFLLFSFFALLECKIISKIFVRSDAWKLFNFFADFGWIWLRPKHKVIIWTARTLLKIKNKLATNKILGYLLGQRPSTLYLLQFCNNCLFPSQTFLKLHFITVVYSYLMLLPKTALSQSRNV